MQRKRVAIASIGSGLVGLLLLSWALSSGCSGTPATQVTTSESQATFANVTLKVACPNETAELLVTQYGQGWARSKGARLETVRYTPEPGVVPQADVLLLAPADLAALADDLAVVPEEMRTADHAVRWPDIAPLYRTLLLTWAGKPVAVPLLGDAVVCYYRKDLIDNPLYQKMFLEKYGRALEAPTTWEDVLEIAAYFNDEWADPKAGHHALPPAPAGRDELDVLFYSVAAPYARRSVRNDEVGGKNREFDLFTFHFDMPTGKPRIDADGFQHALAQLQKMQAYRADKPSADPALAFARGDGVVYIGPVQQLLLFQQHPDTKVRDKVGICQVPGTRTYFPAEGKQMVNAEQGVNVVPYRGTRGLIGAVRAQSPHADAGWSLLAELCGPELGRQIVSDPRWGGCPYRISHLRDRWDGFKLKPAQGEQLYKTLAEITQRGTQNPVVKLRLPTARTYQEALLLEVNRALFENKTPQEALAAAQKAWETQAATEPAHVRWYQQSLGLTPK